MKSENIVNIVLIGGGIFTLYWYLTNYGPNGPAYSSTGQQIYATWWQTWFGSSAPTTTTTAANTNTNTTTANPLNSTAVNTPTSPVVTTTPVISTPVVTTSPSGPPTLGVQTPMQVSANSNAIIAAQNGLGDAYQWSTIWNSVGQTPIPNINAVFFGGNTPTTGTPNAAGLSSQGLPLMPLATWLAAVQASGINIGLSGLSALRGIVNLPSFAGGGKGFSGGFSRRPLRGQGGMVN